MNKSEIKGRLLDLVRVAVEAERKRVFDAEWDRLAAQVLASLKKGN